MIDKFIKKISTWKTEAYEALKTPQNEELAFELKYENLLICILNLCKRVWSFEYSKQFKNQNNIKTLANFSDKNKVYKSKSLYPFFLARIPSLKQAKVQKIVETEKY